VNTIFYEPARKKSAGQRTGSPARGWRKCTARNRGRRGRSV